MTELLEGVDLCDLDLLDDELGHARCTYCQPYVPVMGTYIGLCGAKAVYRDPKLLSKVPPPNACPECKALWPQPCRRCGH